MIVGNSSTKRLSASPPTRQLDAIDPSALAGALEAEGYAIIPGVLSGEECDGLVASYRERDLFRSRVVMARHGYGRGEYQYFRYPLPDLVSTLRAWLYPPLADVANRWNEAVGDPRQFPSDHAAYLDRCHRAGQLRPTPLLLHYEVGDYNCLHQDLYGEHVFPLQATFLLSEPGRDFTGGELLLTEQRPRMQSRPMVILLGQGDGVVFPVRYRPVEGKRGYYRVNVRHGVSRVRSGQRNTLGVIFHDAA
jgi:uncharacterized protein